MWVFFKSGDVCGVFLILPCTLSPAEIRNCLHPKPFCNEESLKTNWKVHLSSLHLLTSSIGFWFMLLLLMLLLLLKCLVSHLLREIQMATINIILQIIFHFLDKNTSPCRWDIFPSVLFLPIPPCPTCFSSYPLFSLALFSFTSFILAFQTLKNVASPFFQLSILTTKLNMGDIQRVPCWFLLILLTLPYR